MVARNNIARICYSVIFTLHRLTSYCNFIIVIIRIYFYEYSSIVFETNWNITKWECYFCSTFLHAMVNNLLQPNTHFCLSIIG